MIKLINLLTESDSFAKYSNDALKDMIVNLSRYEGNEEEIAAAKAELEKRRLAECGDCERQGTDYTHGHDHEASMADGELRDLISNASKLQNMIQPGDELPGWVSAYITLASDYMHSVAEYMTQQGAEMQQQATPGYVVYENEAGATEYFKPKYSKDRKHPNFLYAKIKYPAGSGGALVALGSKTASGQQREEGAKKALAVGNKVAKELESKYNLEDIEVVDLENGIVQVFAVSDDFINLKNI